MADIELVIKISEEQKKMVDAIMELPPQIENDLISAIRHSTPLPKGHGRLIDLNDLYDFDRRKVEYAPTIIETDKAEGGKA